MNPSVRIEVVESGTVDFLIYYEAEEFDIESLILSLITIINAHMGYPYEAIPYYGPEGGPQTTEVEEVVLTPVRYEGINVARWVSSLEEGYIQLDDNSIFYVYDEDQYMSKLWKKHDDVAVSPTQVFGHYYITKSKGPYQDPETLRAICIQAK